MHFFRVGYGMDFFCGNIVRFFYRGSSVACGGSKCGNVDVLGPQAILRPMQVVLHEYDSLANWHMQADLQDTQAKLHNVFATRVDSQRRLQFFCS